MRWAQETQLALDQGSTGCRGDTLFGVVEAAQHDALDAVDVDQVEAERPAAAESRAGAPYLSTRRMSFWAWRSRAQGKSP